MEKCPVCNMYHALDYEIDGVKMCEECYCHRKIQMNNYSNECLQDNTFKYVKDGKSYFGNILGYQCRKGYDDKFFIRLDVNEDNFSIWFDSWQTEKEMAKYIDKWRINIQEFIKKEL
jgi:hypothetical protein